MNDAASSDRILDQRVGERLRSLRSQQGWSLDELAGRSGVSRATLSRLEKGEVSATANVLGRLCASFGLTMTRLMHLVEEDFEPLVRRAAQPCWHDPSVGFRRRSVSPPSNPLAGEVLECALDAGVVLDYPQPPKPGLEHHLVLLEGRLQVTLEGRSHDLGPGDCLRYRLFGASRFATPTDTGARYHLFLL